MRRSAKLSLALLIALGIALQFVPVERKNPMPLGDPEVSQELQWAFRRACYDCHSNETRWPIWAYVAPISWVVVRDVDVARSIVNFSEWPAYVPSQRVALRSIIGPTTAAHRMPLWYYVTLHPDSSLSDSELEALSAWSSGAISEAAIPAIPAMPAARAAR